MLIARTGFVTLAALLLAGCSGVTPPVRRAVQAVKVQNAQIRTRIVYAQKETTTVQAAVSRSLALEAQLEDAKITAEARISILHELKYRLTLAEEHLDALTQHLLEAHAGTAAADALVDQVRDAAAADHRALVSSLWHSRIFGHPIAFLLGAVAMFFGRALLVTAFGIARARVGL